VTSRHFRGPVETPAGATPPPGGGDAPSGGDDEELEELTQRIKELAGRKRAAAEQAEAPPEEEPRVRRRPMPRSGNVNMSVLVGDPQAPAELPERYREVEAPQVSLPAGLAALAWKLAAAAVLMFGLGYLVAVWLRPAAPVATDAAAPPEPSVWRPASIEILQRAVAADRSGDLNAATKLLSDLAASQSNLPGLERYRADLLVRQENYLGAEMLMLAQVNAGREVAQSQYLRAFNAARQRHFDDAARFLEASVAQDPLSADTFYQLGELMRRQGKFAEAVDFDKQALLRLRATHGISPALIAMKSRLAQIEAGQVAEVEAALAAARKTPPLAAEWLFTAAALSLQKGDLAAAAETLTKAREMMPRDAFNAWIEDYYFRAQTEKPELAGLRPGEEERRLRRQSSSEFNLDP